MDWAKAKTILIITFLILNVFMLGMTVFISTNMSFTDDYIKYSKDYLASRNIEIKANIPDISGYTGKVLYSIREYDTDALCRVVFGKELPISDNGSGINIVVGEEIINISEDELYIKDKIPEGEIWFRDKTAFEDGIIEYLKNIGFDKSELLPEKSYESEHLKEMVYNIRYKNFRVFDQRITAQLSKEGFLILTAPNKIIKKDNGKGEVISIYQILVMGGLPSNIVIENIDIGYRRISEGDLYGVPVWRIQLDDGTIMFYNGFTGEKLDWRR
ncbi:MAG: hypothetical protein GX022_04380 [Clostridiaceae bacterium]|nr:hypothetical protein [Clostridiaceae bacterium]